MIAHLLLQVAMEQPNEPEKDSETVHEMEQPDKPQKESETGHVSANFTYQLFSISNRITRKHR